MDIGHCPEPTMSLQRMQAIQAGLSGLYEECFICSGNLS